MPKEPLSLGSWRSELAKFDECPFVGPRPQTSRDGRRMLVGRAQDVERITRTVVDRSLVILEGYSGVGKSSLLQNGLSSELEKAGFLVLVNRKWAAPPPSLDSDLAVERYLAQRIRQTHEDRQASFGPIDMVDLTEMEKNGGLRETLDALYAQRASVLVFDQFEELLRESDVAEKVVTWIKDTGYRSRTRIVISLRTDSTHLLSPMLRGVKPFSMDRVELKEITDVEDIRKIVQTTRNKQDAPEASAVERLLALWQDKRPSILDLQSTLYALHFSRCSDLPYDALTHRVITADDVTEFEDKAEGLLLSAFEFGLRRSISLKIEHAVEAARRMGADEYLVAGTREIVRRAATLLSSGGFKVPISNTELAERTLERERKILEQALGDEWRQGMQPSGSEVWTEGGDDSSTTPSEAASLVFRRLLTALSKADDPLTVHRGDIADFVDLPLEKRQDLYFDRRGVTAGPMMSASAGAALLEEIRRVWFAVEWLESTEIVRRDPGGTLSLVHDGAGVALKAWADEDEAEAESALHRLTAARGEHFVWREEIGGNSEKPKVIANLNWRECRITADFRHTVFMNCDFSGLRFDRCRFQGVTFVNCLLDDANFEYCTVTGSETQRPVVRKDKGAAMAPSFTIATTESETRDLAQYMDGLIDNDLQQLFSDTSGCPARPGCPPPDFAGDWLAHFVPGGSGLPASASPSWGHRDPPIVVSPTAGGIAMIGGRLCYLTVYRCKSENNAAFAFHHVSGDGLDIVEHSGGRIIIHDGAIRGIALTRDQDIHASAASGDDLSPVSLEVTDSFVANVVIADGVRGSASFDRSRLLMLINASENSASGFRVAITRCRHQFIVNTDDPVGDSAEDSETGNPWLALIPNTRSRFSLLHREQLANDLAAMDFRLHPQDWERAQRELRRKSQRQK
jgi:hypothetical protein